MWAVQPQKQHSNTRNIATHYVSYGPVLIYSLTWIPTLAQALMSPVLNLPLPNSSLGFCCKGLQNHSKDRHESAFLTLEMVASKGTLNFAQLLKDTYLYVYILI